MKEVVSEMDIINTSSTQEIIKRNKHQMRFLENLLVKKDVDKKLMINTITCLVLESPYTSDKDDMDNGVYKSTVLEPTIKHLSKEPIICRKAARNLVIRRKSLRPEISLMAKNTLNTMRCCSRYYTITKLPREKLFNGYCLISMSRHLVYQMM